MAKKKLPKPKPKPVQLWAGEPSFSQAWHTATIEWAASSFELCSPRTASNGVEVTFTARAEDLARKYAKEFDGVLSKVRSQWVVKITPTYVPQKCIIKACKHDATIMAAVGGVLGDRPVPLCQQCYDRFPTDIWTCRVCSRPVSVDVDICSYCEAPKNYEYWNTNGRIGRRVCSCGFVGTHMIGHDRVPFGVNFLSNPAGLGLNAWGNPRVAVDLTKWVCIGHENLRPVLECPQCGTHRAYDYMPRDDVSDVR